MILLVIVLLYCCRYRSGLFRSWDVADYWKNRNI